MGKKITLDFSKVEERSGWNSKEMPEGLHEFKIELVDLKDAGDGTTMWTYGLRPTNPKYKTRLFPYYCKHQQNQLFKLRDIFIAAGLTVPKKKTGLDPDAPVGKIIAAELTDATGNYAGRSEIDGVYTIDILEGTDATSGEDDEEYEEEVDEADEVDEDEDVEEDDVEEEDDEEEVDDEELREEIESLTLGELRKRAKGLGIDTDGVKKVDLVELVIEFELSPEEDEDDEDEDDLDDEELEDEELEDEEFEDDEEEEEPVKPARRAASKAPAKAPAKAAAPTRRVVKRR
jgi:hypothetical protein